MDALLRTIVRGPAAFMIFAIALAGCGGHSSGGTSSPPPGVPVISNLSATYASGPCTVRGQPGRPLTVSVHYSDSDGDVNGGTLETTGKFHPSEQSIDVNFLLPSNSATITGTTDGSITAFACVAFNGNTELTIALLDKAGHSSNILSVEVKVETLRGRGNHETGVGGLEMLRP